MKCFINKTKNLNIMLFIGLALALGGGVAARLMGEGASSLAMRLAGFVTGLGVSLVTVSAAWLIWKKIVGARRAQDKELEMGDERGQIINTRAQAMVGFTATLAVIAIDVVALVRGDDLYMLLCTLGCFAIALTGIIARAVLGRKL